jgi:hypothetical protein
MALAIMDDNSLSDPGAAHKGRDAGQRGTGKPRGKTSAEVPGNTGENVRAEETGRIVRISGESIPAL